MIGPNGDVVRLDQQPQQWDPTKPSFIQVHADVWALVAPDGRIAVCGGVSGPGVLPVNGAEPVAVGLVAYAELGADLGIWKIEWVDGEPTPDG